jgi:hypothetical protein
MRALQTPAHYEIQFVSDEAKALIVRQFLTKREHDRRVLRKAERVAAELTKGEDEPNGNATVNPQ